MKLISVGDNVVDCYEDQGMYYPGGNCVNVAVNCKRYGFKECAYIGVFGTDEKAEHIKWALKQEGVRFERSRHMVGISGQPRVSLTPDGDRVFVHSPKNTVQHLVRLRLTQEDLDYIAGFDLCHTSCYSGIEPELPALAEHCRVSFDFSTRTELDYLERVCPYVNIAFFSGSHLSQEKLNALITKAHELGTEVVGVTLGGEGALFSWQGKRYRQGIVPVEVVDTMGAGDSFIAGFLTHFLATRDMEGALAKAAEHAAETCKTYGAFGYPKELEQN